LGGGADVPLWARAAARCGVRSAARPPRQLQRRIRVRRVSPRHESAADAVPDLGATTMSLQTLSLNQVQSIFKNVAKFIFIHQLAGGTVADPTRHHGNRYRRALMAALDQAIS